VLRLALEVVFEGVEGAGHVPVKTAPGSRGSSGSGRLSPARPAPSEQQQQQQQNGEENEPPADGGASPSAAKQQPDIKRQQQDGDTQQQQQQQQQQEEEEDVNKFDDAVTVGDTITVGYRLANAELGYESHAVVMWRGGAVGDMLADAVVAVILQAAGEPPAAAAAEAARAAAIAEGDAEGAVAAEMSLLAALLRAQFGGEVEVDVAALEVRFTVDGVALVVDHRSAKVACEDEGLRGRVERALARVTQAMRPCVLDGEL